MPKNDEPLFIEVITRDLDTGEVTASCVINHNDRAATRWLGKHCFWAFRHNRSIYTRPVSEKKEG